MRGRHSLGHGFDLQDTDNSGLKSRIQNSCLAIFLVCLFEAEQLANHIYMNLPHSRPASNFSTNFQFDEVVLNFQIISMAT